MYNIHMYAIRNKVKKQMNISGKNHCDICKDQNILEIHHILGREIPNYNKPNNRADICSNCHTKVHHGVIVIEGWFSSTNGRELLWHLADQQSFSGEDAKPHIIPRN